MLPRGPQQRLVRVQRRAHMLAGRVTDQLVQTPHIGRIQPGYAAVISHTQKHRAPAAVGERSQLSRHAVGIGGVTLELVTTVFTTAQDIYNI